MVLLVKHLMSNALDLFFTLLLFSFCLINAKNSRAYNAYNYDLTTPQFTPDGRLLQVEYASRAASHSSSCVLFDGILDLDNDYHLLNSNSSSNAIPSPNDGNLDSIDSFPTRMGCRKRVTFLATRRRSRAAPSRIIRLSNKLAVVMSGSVSDAWALLYRAYDEWDQTKRRYGGGIQNNHADNGFARSLAAACHSHALGGGLRPFGATMWVATLAPEPTVVQTDPSGAITLLCSSSTLSSEMPLWQTIGQKSEELKRKLEKEPYPNSLSEALQRLVYYWSDIEDSVDESKTTTSTLDDKKIEVVLLCPQRGIHFLSEQEIKNLLIPSTLSDDSEHDSKMM
jgi:20S proteasome alpha/beta subunit